MDISLNTSASRQLEINQLRTLSQEAGSDADKTNGFSMPPPPVKLEISDAGKIASAFSRLSSEDQADAQDFLTQIGDSIRDKNFNAEELAEAAPQEFLQELEKDGIDLAATLQTMEDNLDNMQGPQGYGPPSGMGGPPPGGGPGGMGGPPPPPGGAAGMGQKPEAAGEEDATTDSEDATEAVEEEISRLKDEIAALEAKATDDEESGRELEAKQTQLLMAQAELALLSSEDSQTELWRLPHIAR